MTSNSWPFILFDDDEIDQTPQDTYRVIIPPRIEDVDTLFEQLSRQLNFPKYFGWNWGALNDCLHQITGVSGYTVEIIHYDIPLQNSEQECKIYINIMCESVIDSPEDDSHRLVVKFPRAASAKLSTLIEH